MLDSRSVSDVKQQLSDVNAELAQQQARYGSAYPAVVALQERRDSLRRELGSEVGHVSQSLQHSYDAASRQVTDLSAQLDQSQQHVGVVDQAEGTAAGLQRELAVEQELYLDTVKKLNALQTDRRVLTGNAELVSYAELPLSTRPFPRKLPFVDCRATSGGRRRYCRRPAQGHVGQHRARLRQPASVDRHSGPGPGAHGCAASRRPTS